MDLGTGTKRKGRWCEFAHVLISSSYATVPLEEFKLESDE